MDATTFLPPPKTTSVTPTTEVVDHPGRWLGGVIGAVASLTVSLGAVLLQDVASFDVESLILVGLLGAPIGFVLGRAAVPWARDAGWRRAATVGMALGWAAPPLGAIEILFGWGVVEALGRATAALSCSPPGLVAALVLLMYAIPISFVAIVVTIPVGVVSGLAIRAVPETWLRRSRMPAPIDALGVRHVLLVLAVVVIAVAVVQIAATAECAYR